MTPKKYWTPLHRARAVSYTLAVLRGDPARNEVLADLSQDDLLRTVEALAGMNAATLNQFTGDGAERVLTEQLKHIQTDMITETEDNE